MTIKLTDDTTQSTERPVELSCVAINGALWAHRTYSVIYAYTS